jgi:hypothetical protein
MESVSEVELNVLRGVDTKTAGEEAIQNVLAQPASENRRPSRPLISRAKPYQQFSLIAAEKKFRDFGKLQLRAPQTNLLFDNNSN